MTHSAKLAVTVIAALIFSLVLSAQPLYRIFPSLLNESLSVAFWMLMAGWGLLRYPFRFKGLLLSVRSALLFCGVFLGALIVQYLLGHSVPYGGYVALHAGAAVACMVTIVGGAAFVYRKQPTARIESVYIALGLLLVALVQSMIGWLQYLELHLSFSWIALQGFGGRAFGNLRQYNLFALLMLLGLLALGLLLERSPPKDANNDAVLTPPAWMTLGLYSLALILMGTLVASISRFGMLMCVFFVVLAFADWRDRKKVRAIFFLSLPVMYLAWYLIFIQLDSAGWLPYYGTQRAISVDALSSQNNSDRLEIWKVAMQLVHNHPWFGIGYGQLPYYSAVEVLGWNFYLILDYAHNFFLQWALDFGLPVALLLLFLLLMMAWHLRALLKHSDGRILIALLMFPVLHEVVEFPLHYPTFLMPWCFLLGFLLASRFVSTRPAEETPALAESRPLIRMKNVSAAIISFVLAVLAIYAIYDSAKPGQLFQSPNAAVPYASIELAYSTIAFEHIADFAVIQTVPTTTGTAAQIHRLAAKVAKVRFDINVATIYMQASALDGRMCVAKSIAYRLANADTKSKDRLFVVLSKRTEPEFRELEAFAKNPYAVDWRPERIGNC